MIGLFQVAENVKEFFHNNGIHSTTIQPEFVESNGRKPSSSGGLLSESGPADGGGDGAELEDCALECPPDSEGEKPGDSCKASVCCPEPKNSAGGGSGDRSEPTTPKSAGAFNRKSQRWRSNSFGSGGGGGLGPNQHHHGAAQQTPPDDGSNPEVQILMPETTSSHNLPCVEKSTPGHIPELVPLSTTQT